jgi:SAM-dependent methyltransferase
LSPPPALVTLVGGDFEAAGAEFMEYFETLGKLQPSESVLDVGCGVGRMALPLTRFLNADGRYEGFDAAKALVEWCQAEITPRYPRFRFQHVDLHNTFYNPDGTIRPSEFRFPYEDASFDFVFLTSVFTHMLPADVEQYTAEVARVLKVGGRCLVTFFLLNEESRGLIGSGLTQLFTFSTAREVYSPLVSQVPEAAVAYDEGYARELLRRHGLTLTEPIHYGDWCGRLDGLSLQDIVLAVKAPAERSSLE